MLNLSMVLEDSARTYPRHPAVVLGSRSWTYAEVDAAANQVAGLLAERGIAPGDRIALACPNVPWYPVVYYGALKAGAVVVPMNVTLRAREMAHYLADSGAKAFFCFAGTPQLPVAAEGFAAFEQAGTVTDFWVITAEPDDAMPVKGAPVKGALVEGAQSLAAALAGRSPVFETVLRHESDPAMILYTSGTSGQPKGAVLSHANLLFNAVACDLLLDNAPRRDVHLVVLPLFHSFATTVDLNAGFASASTLVMMPRFDAAAALEALVAHEITFFAGVPTMYWGLLAAIGDGDGTGTPAIGTPAIGTPAIDTAAVDTAAIGRNLRIAVSAGSALPVTIIEEFAKRFGVTILESYGLSETSPAATITRRGEPPRPGSIGMPIWGVDLKLVDEAGETVQGADRIGEIAIRGHNVMLGYHERPAETAEALRDGWFHTGDLGRRDEDGWYYLVDRVKDMIIRGGYNVYPRELEDVLMRHEDVSLVAVIGVPDVALGEEVKAVVVRRPGATVTEAGIVAWSRQRMAAYKYPRIVEFVDEIPLTATGKPLKRALR